MDNSLGIIAVVPDEWDDTYMARHRVLQRLAAHFPIVWMEPAENWREYLHPKGRRFLIRDRWRRTAQGIDVFTPGLLHPLFYRPRGLFRATFRSRLRAARRQLVKRGARKIALYIWRDEFADALDLVQYDVCVYHVVDEYTFSEKETPTSDRELGLLRRADQVIVHSPALFAKKGGVNPFTVLIPNGVEFASFAEPRSEPPDMAAIPHPRAGYCGIIKKQLNLGLVARLAQLRPHVSFVLVGPIKNVAGKEAILASLRSMPNVYFLGNKDPEQLGAYVQHFGVCLMCYEVNEYTRYIYPLKMNEYLAAGRPVISSPIDSVLGHSNLIAIANTDAEWLAAIDASLAKKDDDDDQRSIRQDFAREHDWDTIVNKIVRLFEDAFARPK